MTDFIANWSSSFPGGGDRRLSFGRVPKDLFPLLDQLDTGVVPATFPSLQGLTPAERRMTIVAATIRLSGTWCVDPSGNEVDCDGIDAISQSFAVSCAQVRQLAFGSSKSILQTAQAVNVAAASPLTAQQIAGQLFQKHFLVWEIAKANDYGEGLTGNRSNQVTSQPQTLVENPVKQLFIALIGAVNGKDHAGSGSKKVWLRVARTQVGLDALLAELGDHTLPAAPSVDAILSPTRLTVIPVVGTAEIGGTVHVQGGSAPALMVTNGAGAFVFQITLTLNAENVLSVFVEDAAGNFSPATSVVVRQDSISPVVSILSPADGSLPNASQITVTGTATDDVSLKEVRVNGVVATRSGATFSASIPLAVGVSSPLK